MDFVGQCQGQVKIGVSPLLPVSKNMAVVKADTPPSKPRQVRSYPCLVLVG